MRTALKGEAPVPFLSVAKPAPITASLRISQQMLERGAVQLLEQLLTARSEMAGDAGIELVEELADGGVGAVDLGFVEAGLGDAGLEVVGDHLGRNAAEEGEGPTV